MRLPQLRAAQPWLIGLGLGATMWCVALSVYLGAAARTDATKNAARQLAAQADGLVREIDGDILLFDMVLRHAARLDAGSPAPKSPIFELPLTAQYVGFINVLNEVGDVVADPRSNVSRPVNFAGRDYFQDQRKNPADVLLIGRPFASAPTQHSSIPISRRLTRPDGGFAGVVVAGVHLTWLSDLLSHAMPVQNVTITIRRDDGLILMRSPYDADMIGRASAADPAWQEYLRTGLPPAADDPAGIHLFRRLGVAPLVLELALDRADIATGESSWLIWLPLLPFIPGLFAAGFGLTSHSQMRRGKQIEADARTANDERMRLLANMSHELRTPLTSVLGQAELMTGEGGLNERQTAHLSKLTMAGTMMRDVVDRVINIARPDDPAHSPVLTPCDLNALLRACLDVVEIPARAQDVLLTSSIDPSVPAMAMLERDRVQQMIVNLLMNAAKYTAHGTISVRVTQNAALLRFEVADTGPGIRRDKQARLFKRYDRLDAADPAVTGSGLGLSITRQFALSMGGQVGYAANPGGGSLFWIEIPFIRAVAPAPAETPPPPPTPEIRQKRILVADDSSMSRSVTVEFLRMAGHTVTEVDSGEAAIAEVQARDFDVLLTDMRMPVVDGFEVARRIRALPGHRARTPIVLVTADLMAMGVSESGTTGIDVCLRKPFTKKELLATVTTAVQLTPVPDGKRLEQPVLDATSFAELKQNLSETAFDTHLAAIALRIEGLITMLEREAASDAPDVRDAVHDLVGVAGLTGLMDLAANLRWFDTARERTAPLAALRRASVAASRALHGVPKTAAVPATSRG